MKTLDAPSSLCRSEFLRDLIGLAELSEGQTYTLQKHQFVYKDGILRNQRIASATQNQTAQAFGFEWHQKERFDKPAVLSQVRSWLVERYGDVCATAWWQNEYCGEPTILDAGCGAAVSAIEIFGANLRSAVYVGADISQAVDMAKLRFKERNLPGVFIQSDLNALPFPEKSFDIIFSEGVLHHTDSTEISLKNVSKYLKVGGRILFYVYKQKAPIREFTDDYIRMQLANLPAHEADKRLMPLTKLGKLLGELDIEVDVPEDIDLLQIPKGKINLQRLIYWYIMKVFYRPDWTVEQMNNCNFDWYAPKNCHRHTPEQIRTWCEEAGLSIEREYVDLAGITMIAKRTRD